MPILDVTYHSTSGPDVPRWGAGGLGLVGALPPQVGDSEQLDCTSAVKNGRVAADPVVAMIVPVDADCRIVIGVGVTAKVQNSRRVKSGVPDYAFIPAGARLSVMAA